MRIKTSAVAGLHLGAAALCVLVGHSIGQDGAVPKSASQGAARTLPPAIVGSIDMDAVFKGYEKVEFIRKQIAAEAELKKGELSRIMAEGQQLAKEMETLQPGSPDFKDRDAKMTRVRANLEAAREQAQREFAQKEAEALATLYKEIQAMVEAVAKHNHMTYVVRISNEPISGADPNSALAAMSRSVVYSDPSTDITGLTLKMLNREYRKATGQPESAAPPADPATVPAASAAPAATRTR